MKKKIYSKSEKSTTKHIASVSLNNDETSKPETVSLKKLKTIKKEIRRIKPKYKQGDTVYLKKKIKHDNETIPENGLCWVEDSIIRLVENEENQYEYKVYYDLLYDVPKINFDDEFDDENDFSEYSENHIMFSVQENDLFNDVSDILRSI